jgi:predicted ATP-binding protein involved in virulence
MPQKKNNSNNSEKPRNAYFLSLELENVRCFGERQKIDFSDNKDNPKRWTIILGNNGTGKTTILKSLVAMLPVSSEEEISVTTFSNSDSSKNEIDFYISPKIAFDAELRNSWAPLRNLSAPLANRNDGMIYFSAFGYRLDSSFSMRNSLSKNGNIKGETSTLTFAHFVGSGNTSVKNPDGSLSNLVCFAYGASRKAGETSISEIDNKPSYITLFDETATLLNPEEWLLRTRYAAISLTEEEIMPLYSRMTAQLVGNEYRNKREKELEKVKEILIRILPDVREISFGEKTLTNKKTSQPIVGFKTHYGWVESKDLSLGYRTSMAWMVDFSSRMFDLYPESKNPLAEPAVVLIDEIDLHLHPKWQRELLDYLSNLFPNTQFIVTTHSPLIVQAAAARDANIVVCRREGDHVVIDQSVEAVKNWRTDQILTSDLFDLSIDRDKKTEEMLERRKQILSKAKLTKADEKKLKVIEEEIGEVPVMADPKYDEAMNIILRAAKKLEKEVR